MYSHSYFGKQVIDYITCWTSGICVIQANLPEYLDSWSVKSSAAPNLSENAVHLLNAKARQGKEICEYTPFADGRGLGCEEIYQS